MILNPNPYRKTLDAMKFAIMEKDVSERSETISLLSLGSHVPIVAVLSYALRPDVLGEDPVLRELIDYLVKFYTYESVAPWEDL